MAEPLGIPAGILQVIGHLLHPLGFHGGQRIEKGEGCIALGSRGQIETGLGQMEPSLRHANVIESLGRAHDHPQGVGIGQAHVFRGENYHAAENKTGILARVDHARHPVQSRVGIRAPHGFDESGNRIEMRVPLLVIKHGLALNRFLGDGQVDGDAALRPCIGGLHRQLQRVKRSTGISVGHSRQMRERVRREFHVPPAISPLRVSQRGQQDRLQILFFQGFQLEYARAADQGFVDLEVGILRGGTDQNHRAVFHMGKQGILLGLVEAVHLVDEKDGAVAPFAQPCLGLGHRFADIGHTGQHGVERGKFRAGGVGDDAGQGGLAGARGPMKNQRGEAVRLDGPPQQPPRAQHVPLTDEFLQGAGAHSGGQGGFALKNVFPCLIEQIHLGASSGFSPFPGRGGRLHGAAMFPVGAAFPRQGIPVP